MCKLAAQKAEFKALKKGYKAALKKATDGSIPQALQDLKRIKDSARVLLQKLEADKVIGIRSSLAVRKRKKPSMRRLENES